MSAEQTRELICQAMKSYEIIYGVNSVNDRTPHDVICRFSGSLA